MPNPSTPTGAPATDPLQIHAIRNREESERLRFLGALVSHDLNNALFALTGRVQLLKLRAQDPAIQTMAVEILAATKYFDQLLTQLHHACARPTSGHGPTSVRNACHDSFREIARSAGPALDGLEQAIAALPADLSFEGESRAIVSAALQCVALHRSRGATRLRVTTKLAPDGDHQRVTISFEDDEGAWNEGLGPPSLLDNSFTLDALPLGAAHRAIRDFGGKVSAHPTEDGLRTDVSFRARRGLPMPQDDGGAARGAESDRTRDACATAAIPAPRPRRILVADDEPAVRAIFVAALEAVDDDVETTDSPASIATRDDLARFDAVVLDAGAGGLAALAAIRARGDKTPVLVASGDTVNIAADAYTRVVQKPFGLDVLDRELATLAALRGR
ncbi:MAG: hypothetical protein ACKO3W_02685 [bacterium]